MPIKISVIGIFFGATLDLTKTTRVIDVLAVTSKLAAQNRIPNVSAFSYDLSKAPNISATSFAATYTGPVKGRELHRTYPPGQYFLPENLSTKPAYSVWQYYTLDKDGKSTNTGIKYLDNPAAVVPEGGSLIWRLVSILGGPNPAPYIVTARQEQIDEISPES